MVFPFLVVNGVGLHGSSVAGRSLRCASLPFSPVFVLLLFARGSVPVDRHLLLLMRPSENFWRYVGQLPMCAVAVVFSVAVCFRNCNQ